MIKLTRRRKFRFVRQLESLDCAPACLKMICENHGNRISLDYLRDVCKTNKLGTSIYTLTTGARNVGLDSITAQMKISALSRDMPLPAVLLWDKTHFVVLEDIFYTKRKRQDSPKPLAHRYLIADPSFGILTISVEDFRKKWLGESDEGIIIFFDPSEEFGTQLLDKKEENPHKKYFKTLSNLIFKYKSSLLLILIGMVVSSLISLSFPVLTQRLVDVGVKLKNTQFVSLILIFQLGLFVSTMFVENIKSWILLHLGTKIEFHLTYDFLSKLMRLPMFFFDMKVASDLILRISDNSRIQSFIKEKLLDFIISIGNLMTLSWLVYSYNFQIFVTYLIISTITILCSFLFLKQREIFDYKRFSVNSENTDNLIETIVGMPEIKLNGAEEMKKNKWQTVQIKLFEVNTKILRLQQYQSSTFTSLNQLKNIIVTFLAAQNVINGSLTLGQMIGLSFVMGQLNIPLLQLSGFIQYYQDARISFKRLAEIQIKKDEDSEANCDLNVDDFSECNIRIENLDFSYYDSRDSLLFDSLSLNIPEGKITALVGTSGSGKTTLMKLLLKFYPPLAGKINVGPYNLNDIPATLWRSNCGVVMQEGHIFNETLENNICFGAAVIDYERLKLAARLSCVDKFVGSLPIGYSTKIGSGGLGLSTGQKQRILIARAIYKNPKILFFDEATSSLDSNNEKEIQQNLELFMKDKTVFIIAHRLSTVKNADNIIVLEEGRIIEQGSHHELIQRKGAYLNLVKNQLEFEL
jgi:ATP-binding cassette, subfamily B, bacterial